MRRVSEQSLGTEVPASREEGPALTTIEREAPEKWGVSEQQRTTPGEITVDTTAADDTDFEPTIVRGRE